MTARRTKTQRTAADDGSADANAIRRRCHYCCCCCWRHSHHGASQLPFGYRSTSSSTTPDSGRLTTNRCCCCCLTTPGRRSAGPRTASTSRGNVFYGGGNCLCDEISISLLFIAYRWVILFPVFVSSHVFCFVFATELCI